MAFKLYYGTLTDTEREICRLLLYIIPKKPERMSIYHSLELYPLADADVLPTYNLLKGTDFAENILVSLAGEDTPFLHSILSENRFTEKVLRAVYRIPYGSTITYKELASKCGNEKAARAVGNALRKNPLPLIYPCHRVIASDGSIGGFSGKTAEQIEIKRKLLESERLSKQFYIV